MMNGPVLLVGCYAFPAELENDNKAVESQTVNSVAPAEENEKSSQPEKRAPLHTVVPGEVKYGPEVKYVPEIKYNQQVVPTNQEVKYILPDPKPTYYEPPQPSTRPQYISYSPQESAHSHAMAIPQQAHLVLMLAVPHPNGQYLMLFPAQNVLFPMYYRAPAPLQAATSGSVPIPGYQATSAAAYQPSYNQPAPPALAQSAGFVAQHQLSYSGPFRYEKYNSAKQQ